VTNGEDHWASIRTRIRKSDGSTAYVVQYRYEGLQTTATFDTEAPAIAFRMAVKAHGAERAMLMHKINPPRRAAPTATLTVAEWLRRYIDNLTGCEQYTIDCYERYLRLDIAPVLGDIPLDALTEEDIARWVKTMQTTKSKKTGRLANPDQARRAPGTSRRPILADDQGRPGGEP